MKKNQFEKNSSIKKVRRNSRISLNKDILQIWNSGTDEIEYYRGRQLACITLILIFIATLSPWVIN